MPACGGSRRCCRKRPAGLAARYGGEEFVVCLPGTPVAGAFEVALKIQTALRDVAIQDETTGNALVAAADTGLYRAKSNGRDRVMQADVRSFPQDGAIDTAMPWAPTSCRERLREMPLRWRRAVALAVPGRIVGRRAAALLQCRFLFVVQPFVAGDAMGEIDVDMALRPGDLERLVVAGRRRRGLWGSGRRSRGRSWRRPIRRPAARATAARWGHLGEGGAERHQGQNAGNHPVLHSEARRISRKEISRRVFVTGRWVSPAKWFHRRPL